MPQIQNQSNRRSLTCLYAPEEQTFSMKAGGHIRIKLKENHDWQKECEGTAPRYHSMCQATLRFLRSSEGLFRWGQLSEKGAKFINLMVEQSGRSRSAPLDVFACKSLQAWSWLTTAPRAIEMTPGVIGNVKEGFAAVKDRTLTSDQVRYKVTKAVCDGTDLVTMYSHTAGNIASCFPNTSKLSARICAVADFSGVVHDVTSLGMNAENLSNIRSVTNSPDYAKATPAMKEAIDGSRTNTWIATAKDVCALVGRYIGLIFVATGMPMMTGIAAATLSLTVTVLAVARKLHQETLSFDLLNMMDRKSVQVITA